MSEEENVSSSNEVEEEEGSSGEEVAPPPKKRPRGKSGQRNAKANEKKTLKKKKEKNEDDKEDSTEDDKEEKATKKPRRRYVSDNPKMIDMVTEAIQELGESDRKGTSVTAIKGYINTNYKVREDMLKHVLKRALKHGLEDKVIARPASQSDKTKLMVLVGRYIVVKQKTDSKATEARARPASLRQFKSPKSKKGKKKKKRRTR